MPLALSLVEAYRREAGRAELLEDLLMPLMFVGR